jgi:hypothetical protein
LVSWARESHPSFLVSLPLSPEPRLASFRSWTKHLFAASFESFSFVSRRRPFSSEESTEQLLGKVVSPEYRRTVTLNNTKL